jgi:hypothetical protein
MKRCIKQSIRLCFIFYKICVDLLINNITAGTEFYETVVVPHIATLFAGDSAGFLFYG